MDKTHELSGLRKVGKGLNRENREGLLGGIDHGR